MSTLHPRHHLAQYNVPLCFTKMSVWDGSNVMPHCCRPQPGCKIPPTSGVFQTVVWANEQSMFSLFSMFSRMKPALMTSKHRAFKPLPTSDFNVQSETNEYNLNSQQHKTHEGIWSWWGFISSSCLFHKNHQKKRQHFPNPSFIYSSVEGDRNPWWISDLTLLFTIQMRVWQRHILQLKKDESSSCISV